MINHILFAGGFHAPLNGLCFALATICGYCIARHYHKINHKSRGFLVSVLVGITIGILLVLQDPRYRDFNYISSHHERIPIGLVGACLGYFLYQIQTRYKPQVSRKKSDNQDSEQIDEVPKSI